MVGCCIWNHFIMALAFLHPPINIYAPWINYNFGPLSPVVPAPPVHSAAPLKETARRSPPGASPAREIDSRELAARASRVDRPWRAPVMMTRDANVSTVWKNLENRCPALLIDLSFTLAGKRSLRSEEWATFFERDIAWWRTSLWDIEVEDR